MEYGLICISIFIFLDLKLINWWYNYADSQNPLHTIILIQLNFLGFFHFTGLKEKEFQITKVVCAVQCTVKCKSVPIGNYSKSVIKTMDNTFIRLFLVFLLSFFTILFTNVSANIEVTFMKKILNKCTRKLQSFEQSDVSFSSKLLAKAVPPSKLKSKYIPTLNQKYLLHLLHSCIFIISALIFSCKPT